MRRYVIISTDAYIDDLAALLFLSLHPHTIPIMLYGESLPKQLRISYAKEYGALLNQNNGRATTTTNEILFLAPHQVRALSQQGGMIECISLAPLSYLAKMCAYYPDMGASISRLCIMGGTFYGSNHSPDSEYNFYNDSHAAGTVLERIQNIVLLPLEMCLRYGAIDIEQYISRESMRDIRQLCSALQITGRDDRSIRKVFQAVLYDSSHAHAKLVLLATLLYIAKITYMHCKRVAFYVADLLAVLLFCHPRTISKQSNMGMRVCRNEGSTNVHCVRRAGDNVQLIERINSNALQAICSNLFAPVRE